MEKKWKSSFFRTPSSTSDFSDPIWARDFGFDLFDSLLSVLDDFTLPMAPGEKYSFQLNEKCEKVKNLFLEIWSSTIDFSNPIWARGFGVVLFDLLWLILDDIALKSKLTDFTLSHGFLKHIAHIEAQILSWSLVHESRIVRSGIGLNPSIVWKNSRSQKSKRSVSIQMSTNHSHDNY